MPAPWKKGYDQPRQHIKEQRCYFANKGPFSQSCGFSNSHVKMCSIHFSRSVVSDFSNPWTAARQASCLSPTLGAYSNSCPLSQWCHPIILFSVIHFSYLQSFQASGSFSMSLFFASGGQGIGASVSPSVLPMNSQGWFPLGLAGLISLVSKGFSRVFSNTIVQKHQFFGTQLSL